MASSFELARTYSTFAGVDINVVFGTELIGEMQALSYAVQREKAPLYVMGRVDPLAFSRGKRGIAGTIISLLLDEHMLRKRFSTTSFIADNHEIYPSVVPGQLRNLNAGGLNRVDGADPRVEQPIDANDVSLNFTSMNPWYVDQIPPVDASIVAVNEYGMAATMRIYGIEILNEGSGFSIDDIVIENQMTYVARSILPWQKLGSWSMGSTTSGPTNTFVPA